MLEHKVVHDILQRIDDDLIEEAVYAKRVALSVKRFATVAAIILICIFLSVGVVAAVSPSFREWLEDGISKNKQVGYLPEFPEVMEETMYDCYVHYPDSEEQTDISLTEEEIENVLEIIVNSESEVLSVENNNMEYSEKDGISIDLTVQNEQYEFNYRLVVVDDNVLTYSINKQALESNDVTEKNYVIYSEELYNLVMEKTGGIKYEK